MSIAAKCQRDQSALKETDKKQNFTALALEYNQLPYDHTYLQYGRRKAALIL